MRKHSFDYQQSFSNQSDNHYVTTLIKNGVSRKEAEKTLDGILWMQRKIGETMMLFALLTVPAVMTYMVVIAPAIAVVELTTNRGN